MLIYVVYCCIQQFPSYNQTVFGVKTFVEWEWSVTSRCSGQHRSGSLRWMRNALKTSQEDIWRFPKIIIGLPLHHQSLDVFFFDISRFQEIYGRYNYS